MLSRIAIELAARLISIDDGCQFAPQCLWMSNSLSGCLHTNQEFDRLRQLASRDGTSELHHVVFCITTEVSTKMSGKDYSQAAFLEFLRLAAISGMISPAVARSRKLAAEQLLQQLKLHERHDLRLLDVDELCSRFHKLQGSTIRPENLQIYNERLSNGLKDFVSWTTDVANFKSIEGEKPESEIVAKRDTPDEAMAREELVLNPPRSPYDIFPVPLREDLVVYIQNVPLDMTRAEASKIAAVIHALALPEEES